VARRIALVVVLLGAAAAASAQDAAYKVIVNASNPTATAKRAAIAQLFMSRSVSWAWGPGADPVDQSMTSPIRDAFSREVLGMPLAAVQNYWRKRLLDTHEVPPLVKASDAEVIGYVAKNPGAVGYVAAATDLPPAVKALKISDPIH